MSTTIDSLDIQITTSASRSAQKIDELAEKLGKLRENAKLTTVVNNLGKLKEKLDDLVQAKEGVQVVKDLAAAMKVLNGRLDPVAKKAANVTKVVKGLSTATKSATTSVKSFNSANDQVTDSINGSSVGLMATIDNYQTLISVVNGVVQAMSNVLSQAIEWDGIQFRFGQSFGENAEEVYDWVLKINEALGISVQEFMQYSGLYASLLNGFGVNADKVKEMAVGLTELSYDIWAFSNDRFKSLEDASEAIRSAITGEIEPIRNAGIALTEASLQEYIDSTHLAGISIEKLTEAQKAEVRYAAMVNSAMNQGIIGTYAREMNTAEGAVRQLTQSLKALVQAFGSLFIPILQVVVPYVTAFVEILTDGIHKLAELLGIDIQRIDWSKTNSGVGGLADGASDAASGLGSAADAAKKLKNYTMGFDELNVIDPNSGSGGAGSKGAGGAENWGSGLDLKSVWDESLLAQATSKVKDLKEKIMTFIKDFKIELGLIGASLAALGVTKLLTQFGDVLKRAEAVDGVLGKIGKMATSGLVIGIQLIFQKQSFDSFMSEGGSIWDYLSAMLIGAGSSFILYKQWGVGGLAIGLGVTAYTSLKSVIDHGGIDSVESATTAFTGLASAIGSAWLGWKGFSKTKIAEKLLPKAAPVFAAVKTWFTATLLPALSSGLSALAAALGVSTGWAVAIVAAVAAAIGGAIWTAFHWDEVKKFFTESVPEWFSGVKESIKNWWNSFDFSEMGYEAGRKIAKAFKDAKEWFTGILDGAKQFFKEDLPNFFKEDVPQFFKETLPTVLKNIVTFFMEDLPNTVGEFIRAGEDMIGGILEGFKSGWDSFWGGIKDWIAGFVQGFKDELEISSPSKLFARIGEFIIEGLLSGITGKWEDLVAWFIEVVAPKFTLEYWLLKFAAITSAFGTKMEEFKTSAKKKWSDIVAWFTKTIKPKFTLEYWTGVFHSLVESFTTKMDEWKLTAEQKWELISTWFEENIAPKLTVEYWKGRFDTLVQAIREKLDEFKKTAGEKWSAIKSWFNKTIVPKLTLDFWKGKFDNLVKAIREKLDEFKKTASDKWNGIQSWYKTTIAPKFTKDFWIQKFEGMKTGFVETIKNMVNLGVDQLNRFIDWLNDNLKFKWDGLTIKGHEIFPGGEIQLFTIPHIPRFENGGFLEDGLFTMNQGEIAGKFSNGRSVVANNEQIIAGISEGVYQAVVAAMSDAQTSGGEQAVNVYLDGKQIYANVKRTESQRGVSLMGNQVGYLY